MYGKRKAVRLVVMNGEGRDGRAKVRFVASPNKAFDRRPRGAVLMGSLIAVRGLGQRRRWATWPPSLNGAVARSDV